MWEQGEPPTPKNEHLELFINYFSFKDMDTPDRKSFLKVLILLLFVVYLSGCQSLDDFNRDTMTMRVDSLRIIKPGWIGNPVDEDGKFVNHEFPANQDYNNFFLWQVSGNPQKEEKKNDSFRLKTVNASEFLKSSEEGIVLIGHASFLIRIGGKLIITDPQFTSPSMWNKRYTTLPFKIEELTGIDFILLSHDHFDHMDEESLKQLYEQNPKVIILTGLRTAPLMEEWMPGVRVMEAGWYQEYRPGTDSISVTFLPSRHWSRRGLFDQNLRLWGSFLIKSNNIKIYFGGDSGYGSHFEEVYNLFGEVDYALIGIGAYKPRWFMHQNHTSPLEALRAARLMKAKNLIPMHYGTFAMGDEPLGDPHRTVTKEYTKRKYNFKLILPDPGEKITFKQKNI